MSTSVTPAATAEYAVRLAATPGELAAHFRLRRAVFCEEQGIFAHCDRDALDGTALAIVALDLLAVAGPPDGGEVVGTVRIHGAAEPGLWRGSRLAVARAHRRVAHLGTELIRVAVGTAHARGARRFLAHVQAQNVPLFERLHWCSLAELDLHGRPHHEMEADLAHYPPLWSDPDRAAA